MEEFVKSPLNYVGGKFKILDQIFKYFPTNINNFYDLFCGGLNVSINVNCNGVIYSNDIQKQVIDLYEYFKNNDIETILDYIEKTIMEWGLNKDNEKGYLDFRSNYIKDKKPIDFFILNCHSFNNSFRFNLSGGFNMHFGKRDFNLQTLINLKEFITKLKNKNINFSNFNFVDFDLTNISKSDYVYIDPPYLITTAVYNKFWGDKEELKLLNTLSDLNERGIRFGLSNVLELNGKSNDILKKWILDGDYNVYDIDISYSNSSHHKKIRGGAQKEVFITNYTTTPINSLSKDSLF
jgi:DNA adenine methylase Dam